MRMVRIGTTRALLFQICMRTDGRNRRVLLTGVTCFRFVFTANQQARMQRFKQIFSNSRETLGRGTEILLCALVVFSAIITWLLINSCPTL